MDSLDKRKMVELGLEQFRKWMDVLGTACITSKGKEPVLATTVVWLIWNGQIQQIMIEDQHYHQGELVLVNWRKGDFY
jgi:hypothetical protein